MRDKLYWALEKRSLCYAYFMFFDTVPHLADQLFIRHEVRVWFDREYAREGFPYTAVLCHVRKKDVQKFLAAMDEMKSSMLLCGHPCYEAEISSLMDSLQQTKGAVKQSEIYTGREAEQE